MATKTKLTHALRRRRRDACRSANVASNLMRALERLETKPDDPAALVAVRALAWRLGKALDWLTQRHCRVCGCTDDQGCEDGCEWVGNDLCSVCEANVEIEGKSC